MLLKNGVTFQLTSTPTFLVDDDKNVDNFHGNRMLNVMSYKLKKYILKNDVVKKRDFNSALDECIEMVCKDKSITNIYYYNNIDEGDNIIIRLVAI